MGLKVNIPDGFTPSKPVPPREQDERTVQYWVYTDDDNGKNYKNATGEETYEWAKSLFDKLPIENGSRLGLMVAKARVLDLCMGAAIVQYRNLFGGPEFWDTLESWQRLDKPTKKEKKDK